jgi:imidazolonepropionase-like amidohydrolase
MLALIGGRVMPAPGEEIESGVVLVDAGRIVAVESRATVPVGSEIVDVTGKWLLPGLVDAHTHVGILEESIGWAGNDVNETTDPITPHLRAIDAINPADEGFADALRGGVTTVVVHPGSANVVGGTSVALKTSGISVDGMVVRDPVGLKAALGENPKRIYGDQKKPPATRMASAALLREAFVKASNYRDKRAQAETDGKPFDRDLRMEPLVAVLERRLPLRLHAHRADDILTALRIRDEFGFELALEHATEGGKVAALLAAGGIPALIGPMLVSRSKVEVRDRAHTTPAQLVAAGVKVAIITDHPVVPIEHLWLQAMVAVREGMTRTDALRAVTTNPAEICGVDDRVGRLATGLDADIQMLGGPPFDIMSRVEAVYVSGKLAFQRGQIG